MGAVIIPLLGLYLLLLAWATRRGWRWAQERGWQGRKRWLGAAYGFLIVYLPVFWDWIPTMVAHKYYCETQAGFWVYKTPEEWKQENPGVMGTLVENNSSPVGISPDWPKESWNNIKIASINERFGMIYKDHLTNNEESELSFHVWRWKKELVDKKTGEIIAKQINFSTGNGYIGGEVPIMFWLQAASCPNGEKQSQLFGDFLNEFKGKRK